MPRPAVNKQALNSLTELYFVFTHLVEYRYENKKETKRDPDIFYMRGLNNEGGLKSAIETAYGASNIDPDVAGIDDNPLTLERMLPYRTIASYTTEDKVQQVQDAYADLKFYNDKMNGHEGGMDDASIVMKEKGEEILRKLRFRDSSGTEDTEVDMRTAHIAHEGHSLVVGHVRIKLQSNSIGDLAANYMINEVDKGEVADSRVVARWVTNHSDYMGEPTTAKGVHSALNKINTKLKAKLQTVEKLFDTSPRNGVVRNF